jgi:hypothetical protein
MTAGGPGKFRWRYGRSRPRRRSKALPLTPTLSPKGARGKGADLQCIQGLSSTPDLQVGVLLAGNSVSSLSRGEGARGKGADLQCIQDLSSTPDLQVGVLLAGNSASSLSRGERARGKGADLQCIQDLSSTPDLQVGVLLAGNSVSSLSRGEGARGEGSRSSVYSGLEFDSGLASRCTSRRQLGQLPLTRGEGEGEGS